MGGDIVVSLVAVAIAAVSLITTAVMFRRKADDERATALERRTAEYVDQLESRVATLETDNDRLTRTQIDQGKELKDCLKARADLTEQNFRLYLRIDELEATIKRGTP